MKKIIKKRLTYYCPWTKHFMIGGEEFDGDMSDSNILGAIHEIGRTKWCPTGMDNNNLTVDELWLLRPYPADPKVKLPMYKITVEEFYILQPQWFDRVLSFFRLAQASPFQFRCFTPNLSYKKSAQGSPTLGDEGVYCPIFGRLFGVRVNPLDFPVSIVHIVQTLARCSITVSLFTVTAS